MDIDGKMRALLVMEIKRSGKTRYNFADAMSKRLEFTLTESALNDFLKPGRPGRPYRFPVAWVPAFCEVAGSDELIRALLTPDLRVLVALGESTSQSRRLSSRPAAKKGKAART